MLVPYLDIQFTLEFTDNLNNIVSIELEQNIFKWSRINHKVTDHGLTHMTYQFINLPISEYSKTIRIFGLCIFD